MGQPLRGCLPGSAARPGVSLRAIQGASRRDALEPPLSTRPSHRLHLNLPHHGQAEPWSGSPCIARGPRPLGIPASDRQLRMGLSIADWLCPSGFRLESETTKTTPVERVSHHAIAVHVKVEVVVCPAECDVIPFRESDEEFANRGQRLGALKPSPCSQLKAETTGPSKSVVESKIPLPVCVLLSKLQKNLSQGLLSRVELSAEVFV